MSGMVNSHTFATVNPPVLLLGFEGADGSTATSDESPAAHGAATFFSAAQIDTAQFKFGSSSLLLAGTDDRITFPDHADWHFGSGEFTVETWVRFSALSGFKTFVSHWFDSGSQKGWLFDFPGSANNLLRFAFTTDGNAVISLQPAWTPSINIWYHVAASRVGNTLRVFAGGSSLGSRDMTGVSLFNSTTVLRVGTVFDTGQESNEHTGWLDELRITKGVGLYSANFTPPTAPFPR